MKSGNHFPPWWAYSNTAMLFAPIVLGLGVFRMWFIPNPTLWVPALFCFVLYYIFTFFICKQTSRAALWVEFKGRNPTWSHHIGLIGGLLILTFCGFAGFYSTIPGLVTASIGVEVRKEFGVSSVVRYSNGDTTPWHCRNWISLVDASPAFGSKFCVSANEINNDLAKGSRVYLYGKESIFGFRFTRIGSV